MITKEYVVEIPDFPGYWVGNRGNIWSEKFGRRRPLKLRPCGKYLKTTLRKDGKSFDFLVHRLVLLTFRGPCPPGMESRHLDGDHKNNNIYNLIWGTHQDNGADRIQHGTIRRLAKAGYSRKELREIYGHSRDEVARILGG